MGRRKGVLKSVFKIYSTSHYPALIWLVINSVNMPKLSLFGPLWHLVSDLSQSSSHFMNPYIFFSLTVAAGSDSEALVVLGI